jgi:hypothetical protein
MHSIALHHGITQCAIAKIFATTHHVECSSAHTFHRMCIHSFATFQGSGIRASECMHIHFTACAHVRSFSHIHQVSNTAMSNVSWSTMSNSTQSSYNTTSASMLSVGGLPPVPNPVGGPPNNEAIGPIAALKQCATTLLQHAHQAAVVARDVAADAADINNAHAIIIAQHRKMFLVRAFGINLDGTPITNPSLLPEKLKTYKSVKSVKQYNYIIKVFTNWGDDNVLKAASLEDPDANACRNFRKKNIQGYSYVKQFQIEEAKGLNGSLKVILKHKKSGGIVLHMLDIFNIIHEAHSRQGHLKVDKTLANV